MTYTLTQFASDIRSALTGSNGRDGKEKVCGLVSKALRDQAFIAEHLKARAPGGNPREVLYEDPELGFCICGHVYEKPAHGEPHDHGTSWAIYGLAEGDTEMTDWKIVKKGEGADPSLVEPVKSYVLRPGDAHYYDVGVVHSPKRDTLTRLIRIEGANLDHVKRSNIKAASKVAA